MKDSPLAFLASREACTGCMACLAACRRHVLYYTFDRDGYFRLSAPHADLCTQCGACRRVCPVVAPSPEGECGQTEAFAAWNERDGQRRLSASGGVFSALASEVLARGGTVYGAAIEGFEVRHRRVTTPAGLPALQGTKYQLSLAASVYPLVRDDLRAGLAVLFSGMSCQVAALRLFLGKTDTRRLFTVDTICGGVSTLLPMRRLAASGLYSGVVSFRDKREGWRAKGFRYCLRMRRTDGGETSLGSFPMVLHAFSSPLMKQSACLGCRFGGVSRPTDFTLGDYWGDTAHTREHAAGLSCLLVHTEKGRELVRSAHVALRPTTVGDIARCNPALYWSRHEPLRHAPERRLALFFLRMGWERPARILMRLSGGLPLPWKRFMRRQAQERQAFLARLISNPHRP